MSETPSAPGYDAYVSYSEADRSWVEAELAPRLTRAGYRLCLEDDLPPGGVELEERCRAVATSRKTLLVLSAQSDHRWAMIEEVVTRELDPAAQKRRLIPIVRTLTDLPLRIRPLVAVDLRGAGEPRQWQRLLEALDPARQPAGPLQRLSLRLAELTAELVRPNWHVLGAIWLALGYLGVAAAITLANVMLWEIPPLRHSLTVLLAAVPHVLAALGWREDHDVFRRLSHVLGRSWPGGAGVLAAVALIIAGWWWAGLPEARAIACAPWPCREPGKVYLALEQFTALLPETATAQGWAEAARGDLVQKLSGVADLKLQNVDFSGVDDEALQKLDIDYYVSGRFERDRGLIVNALLSDRHRQFLPGVEARVPGDGSSRSDRLELQQRLALALLERLGIKVTPGIEARLAGIPTRDVSALELDAEGFGLLRQERFEEAEEKLRAAVEKDDGFAAAWSNRAEVAWRQGRYEQALEYRRAAVDRLPSYALFRYNLGQLLAQMGRTEEARAALEQAIELDVAHAPSYNELGNVLLDLEKPELAIEALRKGTLLAPDSAPLAKNLGRALLAADDLAAAIPTLERSLLLYPPADWLGQTEARALLVEASARRRDREAACGHLAELQRLDPGRIAPWGPKAEAATAGLRCAETNLQEKIHV